MPLAIRTIISTRRVTGAGFPAIPSASRLTGCPPGRSGRSPGIPATRCWRRRRTVGTSGGLGVGCTTGRSSAGTGSSTTSIAARCLGRPPAAGGSTTSVTSASPSATMACTSRRTRSTARSSARATTFATASRTSPSPSGRVPIISSATAGIGRTTTIPATMAPIWRCRPICSIGRKSVSSSHVRKLSTATA